MSTTPLHRSDMTLLGLVAHDIRVFSVARIRRAGGPRILQWCIDGRYVSGSASRCAKHLDRWAASLPVGPRMHLNADLVALALALRDFKEGRSDGA